MPLRRQFPGLGHQFSQTLTCYPPTLREPWNCWSVSEISYCVVLASDHNRAALPWPVFTWSPPGYTSMCYLEIIQSCCHFSLPLFSLVRSPSPSVRDPFLPVLCWGSVFPTQHFCILGPLLSTGHRVHIGFRWHSIPFFHTLTLTFRVLFQPCSSPASSVTPSERSSLGNAKTGKGFSSFLSLRKHPYPRLLSLRWFPSHPLHVLVWTAGPPTNSLHASGYSNLLELASSSHSEASRRRIHSHLLSRSANQSLPHCLCPSTESVFPKLHDPLVAESNGDDNKFTLKTWC